MAQAFCLKIFPQRILRTCCTRLRELQPMDPCKLYNPAQIAETKKNLFGRLNTDNV